MAASTAPRAGNKIKTQVLLVDDHPIVRKGIAELINSEPDLEVCGEAASMQEAMSLASKLKPNLLIVDISLDGFDDRPAGSFSSNARDPFVPGLLVPGLLLEQGLLLE